MAKRVGQITPICYPKPTRAYCCTKPNWIGSSRLWNTRPRPHSLGLPAYIFAGRKKIAGRYFRGKIFSREDIFAGSYFRGKIFSREDIFAWTVYSRKYLLAKIFQIPFSRNFLPAKIKCYTVPVLLFYLVCAAARLFCACSVSVQVSAPYVIELAARMSGTPVCSSKWQGRF